MLVITAELMQQLKTAARQRFDAEMLKHLAAFSPPLFKVLGEAQMRVVIRQGIASAARHGFDQRGPVRFYLELVMLFGSHFDTDPQYPWAAAALEGEGVAAGASQLDRAEHLFELTRAYRARVAGREDVHTFAALRNIAAMARRPAPLPGADLGAALLQEILWIYPQKAQHTAAAALHGLVQRGIDSAAARRFPPPRGALLMTTLMLAFGHGCCDDPLYPWIARTLADPLISDDGARAARLERRALTWLDHVLAQFDAAPRGLAA